MDNKVAMNLEWKKNKKKMKEWRVIYTYKFGITSKLVSQIIKLTI